MSSKTLSFNWRNLLINNKNFQKIDNYISVIYDNRNYLSVERPKIIAH